MNVPERFSINPLTGQRRPVWTINVSMHNRDALLVGGYVETKHDGQRVRSTGCGDGHKGVWFYDPSVIGGTPQLGDLVIFTQFYSDVLAVGRVTGRADPNDYPKWCSRINHEGFTWEDVEDDSWVELPAVIITESKFCRVGGWEL